MKKNTVITIIVFILLLPIVNSQNKIDINKKYVALTFDDGPSKYTDDIIELLDKYNAHATFFVLGSKLEYYTNTLENIISKGSEIANHTYSHPWLTHLSVNKTNEEINKTNDLIYNLTGFKPTLFRPSYGDINSKVKNNINMRIIMWTNDSSDWKYKNSKTIASNVIRHIKDNDIILMHDTYKRSYDALKIILPKLNEMGYQIVTVSSLLNIKEIKYLNEY